MFLLMKYPPQYFLAFLKIVKINTKNNGFTPIAFRLFSYKTQT
jgi:hypothetical protein